MRIALPAVDGTAAQRTAAEKIADDRGGTVTTLYRLLLHSPPVALGWCALGTAVRYQTAIGSGLRELLICFVASLTGAHYEWEAHAPLAAAAGITAEQLDSLGQWRVSTAFSASDRVILDFAAGLLHDDLNDEDVQAAEAVLGSAALVEVAATVCYYAATARLLRAFDVHSHEN